MTRFASAKFPGAAVLAACLASMTFLTSGCETPTGESLWDNYDLPEGTAPQITAVDPPERTLAGIGTMTVTGSNFSSTATENLVYFNNTRAQVVEASPTQLIIQTPNIVGENVRLRVSVLGAEEFSNEIIYRFDPAVESVPGILGTDEPWAIDLDAQGNLFMSYSAFEAAAGIVRISPDAARDNYTPPRAWRYANMRFADDGSLFLVRGGIIPIIYRVPPGGGVEETWLGPAGLGRMQDLDFDDAGIIWAGGQNADNPAEANRAIFRIDQDREITRYPFEGDIRSIRVFDGHLYISGSRAGQRAIWRFPITGQNDLGPEELFFDFSAQYPDPAIRVLTMEFTAEGDMFLGIDGPEGLILVQQDGSWEDFYPGLIPPAVIDLAWGPGSLLYAVIEPLPGDLVNEQTAIRIETMRPGLR